MDKPAFDPSQPFEVAGKPAFDPSQPFEAAPQVGAAEDAAKSIGAGLGSGALSILGAPGDITNLGAKGIEAASNYIGGKLGIEPYKRPEGPSILDRILPTRASLRATVTDPVVSPDYQPQTFLGGVLKTGAELAPAIGGGPEGVAAKLLTRVAAPAVASEAAGELTKDTAAEPWARVAGIFAGAGGMSAATRKFQEMAAARQAAKVLPTGEGLLDTGGNQFNAARDMNVVVKPDFAVNAANDMRAAIKDYDPNVVKDVHAAANRLESLGAPTAPPLSAAQRLQAEMNWEPVAAAKQYPVLMNDAENIRKQLVSLKSSPDGSIRSAAKEAIQSLQNSQMKLTAADTLAGDAGQYRQLVSDAVGNWAAGRRAQTVQGKVNLAELNQNSPVGMLDSATGGQALQRTMKQLARPVNNTNMPVARKLGFNNQEVAAVNEAASGTKMQHAAELMDRLIPAKLGAIPAAVARQIGGLTTKRQVAALDSLVRSRSPLAAQVAAQFPPQIVQQMSPQSQALLSTLVAVDPILSDQRSGNVGGYIRQ